MVRAMSHKVSPCLATTVRGTEKSSWEGSDATAPLAITPVAKKKTIPTPRTRRRRRNTLSLGRGLAWPAAGRNELVRTVIGEKRSGSITVDIGMSFRGPGLQVVGLVMKITVTNGCSIVCPNICSLSTPKANNCSPNRCLTRRANTCTL